MPKDVREAAYKLRLELGKPDWLVSIGIIPHLETIVLYTSTSELPVFTEVMVAEGYKGYDVVARVLGGKMLSVE